MLLRPASITRADIIPTSDYNLHPWEHLRSDSSLLASFNKFGVLHPPIVKPNKNNRSYTLISGRKRFDFLSGQSEPEILCLCLDESIQEKDIMDLIYVEARLHKALSLVEKARYTEIYLRKLNVSTLPDELQRELDLPSGKKAVSQLLSLLVEPEEVINATHACLLSDKMVWELLKLQNSEERVVLVRLFRELMMGDGKQRKFFKMIRDLAYREGNDICQYLQRSEIQDILTNNELNIPQKIQHLGSFLQQASTPTLYAAHRAFSEQIKNIDLPQNCNIQPSKSFEKNEVTLTITFQDLDNLKKKFKDLKDVLETQP